MTHLQELYLNRNQMTTIPMVLSEIPTLRMLSLSHNRIADFPQEFQKVCPVPRPVS